MTELAGERCVACRRGSPRVRESEIEALLTGVPEWVIAEEGGVGSLRRRFRFRDFLGAVDFSMEVATLAEEEGHHPRLVIEWGWVTIEWWTHVIRGLHRNDFIMAAKTDRCYERLTERPS